MGDFNLAQGGRFQTLPVPSFITVPHSALANTKGAYVELIAATAFDWKCLTLFLQSDPIGAGPTLSLTDLAIGAAGSEQVLIPNILSGTVSTFFAPTVGHMIPIGIPAGVRISARGQHAGAGAANSYIGLAGFASGFPGMPILGRAVALGVTPATTAAITVTANAIANVKGVWAEIVAATPNAFRFLWAIGARPNTNFSLDIGIGGAGSEVVIVPDVLVNPNAGMPSTWPVAIPAGVRLAARCSSTVAGSQVIAVALEAIG